MMSFSTFELGNDDWGVGHEAESLNVSLFGHKKKTKNSKTAPSKNSSLAVYDSDDETYTKKEVKKMKEKRRKDKKQGKISEETADVNGVSPVSSAVREKSDGSKLELMDASVNRNSNKKNKSKKLEGPIIEREQENKKDKKDKQKKKVVQEITMNKEKVENRDDMSLENENGKAKKKKKKKSKNKITNTEDCNIENMKAQKRQLVDKDSDNEINSPPRKKKKSLKADTVLPNALKSLADEPESDATKKRQLVDKDSDNEINSPPRKKKKSLKTDTVSPIGPKTLTEEPESDSTKKRKRNHKKKNNSKKNKYAHLVLNKKANENDQEISKPDQDINTYKKKNKQPSKNDMVQIKSATADLDQALDKSITKKKSKVSDHLVVKKETPDAKNKDNLKRKLNVKQQSGHAKKPRNEDEDKDLRAELLSNQNMENDSEIRKEHKNSNAGVSNAVGIGNQKENKESGSGSGVVDKELMKNLMKKQNQVLTALSWTVSDWEKLSKGKATQREQILKKFGCSEKKLEKICKKMEEDGDMVRNMEENAGKLLESMKKQKASKPLNKSETNEDMSQRTTPQFSETNKDETSVTKASIWGNKSSTLGNQAREKLNAARFRYLNEQMYTCEGKEALKMFREDREAFSVYHTGFENQAAKWPVNPVNIIAKQLKEKSPSLVVADFGCGDAKLAQTVPQKVHSFDLVALNPRVTACDMTKVPLEAESVDIAVFCLSLMGTNLAEYIREANRVLKKDGLLKIVEVVSRFKGLSPFLAGVTSYGFKLLNKRDVNDMFYMMDFRKDKPFKKGSHTKELSLKPCIYKRR